MAGTEVNDIPIGLGAQFMRHSPRFAVGMAFLAGYQILQRDIDLTVKDAVDEAVAGNTELVQALGVAMVVMAIFAFIIRVLSRMAIFDGGRIAEYELRRALLDRLHTLGPSFYGRMSTGEVMSRVTNDLAQVRTLLGFGVLTSVNTVFALVSALSVMLPISSKLTAAALSVLPLLFLVMRQLSGQLYTRQRENQEALGSMSESVQASIAGVRVIRSFGLEAFEARRFDHINQDYLTKALAIARLRGSMWPVMQTITAISVVIVFWYGGHLMLAGELTEGDFLAFYRALSRLVWPLIAIGFLVSVLQRGRAGYDRIAEVYSAIPDIVDGDKLGADSAAGSLDVRGLSFAYGESRVLNDVSFELPAGSSLAIVGRTGSGKSTIASLLARLQPTPTGTVFLDGVDVCELPLSAVREVIGFSQQNPFLFSTTVGRNIGYTLSEPDSQASDAIIRYAASEAQILPEVEDLPNGFDTVVGERGVQLSGGQKQRVALARAFVKEPKILVLDDPLSAVDARTEKAILETIDRQRAERGVLLITHRVSAASRCDQILVLDKGVVVARGTHEQLVAREGLYATFAEEQRIEGELARLSQAEEEALHV